MLSLLSFFGPTVEVYGESAYGGDSSKAWTRAASGYNYVFKATGNAPSPIAADSQTSAVYRAAFERPTERTEGLYSKFATRRVSPDSSSLPPTVVALEANKTTTRLSQESAQAQIAPGAPLIPVSPVRLFIPDDRELVAVQVTPAYPIQLPGSHLIDYARAPTPLIDSPPQPPVISADPAIYESSAEFPSAPAGLARIDLKHGLRVLTLNLYPVVYVPATGKVSYYPFFDIKLEFGARTSADVSGQLARPKSRLALSQEVAKSVDNPQELNRSVETKIAADMPFAADGIGTSLETGNYDYIIITSESLKNGFAPLLAQKSARGLTARTVSIEQDIVPNYTGTENGDLQDKIRQFIRDAYSNWGTRWVLLGGANEIIPNRGVVISCEEYSDASLPTDLYYACLDGPWNRDLDQNWGEATDGIDGGDIDLTSEVYIGRAPVNNLTDVSRFVAKTIYYETTPHPRWDRVELLGEKLDDETWGSYSGIRIRELALPRSLAFTQRYDENAVWSNADIVRDLNAGPHLVDHLGHAGPYYNARMLNSHVSGLTNIEPYIMYSQGCYSAAFDEPNVTIAEQHLIAERGAVAVIMNTRYGWYYPGTEPSCSYHYDLSFWEALFAKSLRHLGEAHQQSKESNLWRVEETGVYRWIHLETLLLGDPETSVQGPLFFSVSGLISLGATTLSGVTIDAGVLGTFTTNHTGTYQFGGIESGTSYTITPSKTGYTFTPPTASGTFAGNVTENFVASLNTYTISGRVASEGRPLAGVVIVGSEGLGYRVTDADGNYIFSGVDHATEYTLTPSKEGYTFSPNTVSSVLTANSTQDFTPTPKTYTISGTATLSGAALAGVVVLGNGTLGSRVTDSNGFYRFEGIAHGTQYLLAPSKTGFIFDPASLSGIVTGNVTHDISVGRVAVSGKITAGGVPLSSVAVSCHPGTPRSTSNSLGQFAFNALAGESCQLTPTKSGYAFAPPSVMLTLRVPVTQNFTAKLEDSDGDGVKDEQESADGTNPLDPGSFAQRLGNMVCSEWNGFLEMSNILENVNSSTESIKARSTLFSVSGTTLGQRTFSIKSGGQFDLIVPEMAGFKADSYGKVCTSLTKGKPGDWDGRMVYYKPDNSGGYQFAFAIPFSSGLTGRQYVQFNTSQVSALSADASNLVANWMQVTNLGTTPQKGTLRYYSQKGSLREERPISLSAGARIDSPCKISGTSSGLVEWIPNNKNARFQVRNVRYYYDNPHALPSFDSAFQYEAMRGSGEVLSMPLDTRNSGSLIEVSNTLASSVKADVRIYSSSGALKKSLSYTIGGYATWYVDVSKFLPNAQGLVRVKGSVNASLIASVTQIARTTHGKIQNLYALHGISPMGSTLKGSYNTYLGQSCSLLLANPTSSTVKTLISMSNSSGVVVMKGTAVSVPANGLVDYDLCSKGTENAYGTVNVQPAIPNSIQAIILRKGANDAYRFPVPVRE